MLSNSRIIWFAKQWPHQDVARLEVAVRDGVLAVRPLDLRVQVRQPARERVHQPNLKFTVQCGQIRGWIDLNVGVPMAGGPLLQRSSGKHDGG